MASAPFPWRFSSERAAPCPYPIALLPRHPAQQFIFSPEIPSGELAERCGRMCAGPLLDGNLTESQGSTETLWAPVPLGTFETFHAVPITSLKKSVSPFY